VALPPRKVLQAALPLVVALVMLAVASAFGVWQEHAEPPQASHGTAAWAMAGSGESDLSDATSMPATPQDPGSGRPLPSHDADNEEDGTGDSLEVSAVVAVLVLLARGGLLLALRDGLAKLFCGCSLASERPG
jgi:hypothetical protein